MGPGPAGIAQLEYMFSRIVCVSVPIGYTILLVILVIAGIKYLTSGGEPKAVTSAHQTVTWGLLGVVFLAIAWLILQLIQNFTGIEVTKFTLSSLPGVQGFTGSCWESPPISSTQTTASTQTATSGNQQSEKPSGLPFPVYIHLASCDDHNKYMAPVSFGPGRGGQYPLLFTYRTYLENPFTQSTQRSGFSQTFVTPQYINVMEDSLDNNSWALKGEGVTRFEDFLKTALSEHYFKAYDFLYRTVVFRIGASGALENIAYPQGFRFARFEKNKVPKGLAEAVYEAQQSIKDYLQSGKASETATLGEDWQKQALAAFANFDFDAVHLIGLACPNEDFYNTISLVSPLLYLYPNKPTHVSLAINSPVISRLSLDNNAFWHLTALPDGTLTIQDGQNLRFIPYEFLRRDFRRPKDGFVVDKEHLISFLKENLWKKLGLTEQEIADYWEDLKWRIPESPYYFISLIDRAEIDRVLPLEVDPQPDTIIRNMTYILPLNKPFIPIPINIKIPERNGFTVLENGGFIDGF